MAAPVFDRIAVEEHAADDLHVVAGPPQGRVKGLPVPALHEVPSRIVAVWVPTQASGVRASEPDASEVHTDS